MRQRLFFALLLMLGACAGALPSHDAAPRFRAVGADELPTGVVTSLAEDRAGFLWLGTAVGLVRYDGYRFVPYTLPPAPGVGAAALFVRSLHAGADGTLWVGSDFSGLLRHDPALGQLRRVPLGAGEREALSINAIAEGADRLLWAGTDGDGLFALQADGQVQRHRRADGTGLPDDRIGTLAVDREGTLWAGTWAGLARRAAGSSRFEPVPLDAAPARIAALHADAAGALWIGTHDGRLFRRDRDGAVARMPAATGGAASVIHAVLQVDAASVWVARSDGIELRDAASGALHRVLRHDPDQPAGIAGNEVRALLRDRGGQVWIAGYGLGVQRHDPRHAPFTVLDRSSAAGRLLGDPSIRSIAVLRDGRVLLGSHDRGIAVLDAALAPIEVLRDADGAPLFRGVRVGALAEAADGDWWLGTDAGLFRRALRDGRLQPFALGPGRVRRLFVDRDGDTWAGTESGLFRLAPGGTAFEAVPTLDGPALDGDINAIDQAPDGAIWIGGDRGLAVVPARGEAARWVAAAHPARGGNPDVVGLRVDPAGAVWFDTPAGLFRVQVDVGATPRVDAMPRPDGARPGAFGANLLLDARGRVWTQHHVLDPASGRVVALGAADGVEIGSAWFRAHAATADGRLLFGGSKGLLVVDPARYDFPDYDAPLAVTEVRIDDTPRAWDGEGVLALQPGDRRLAVEFAALDYSAPLQLRYRYRVVGEDDAWHAVEARYRVATLANLAPGDYRIEVEASDRHGRWTGLRLAIPVTVQPAWWQRGVFHLALAIGAALLVGGLVRSRTHRLRARQADLERRVAARTAELAATSAALQEKTAELERASLTDALTGLHNRRYLAAHIDADVALCRRRHVDAAARGTPARNADLVFFLIDLDHFKRINDASGHAAGDAVLVQMRQRLSACFRDSDHLVRWGGEEFLVVSRDADRTRAAELAARAVAGVSGQVFALPGGGVQQATCSVGYAALPLQPALPDAHGWADAVALADVALYAAKQAGRDGWVGIELAGEAPVGADLLRAPQALFAAGRLRVETSLPRDAVHSALAGHDTAGGARAGDRRPLR